MQFRRFVSRVQACRLSFLAQKSIFSESLSRWESSLEKTSSTPTITSTLSELRANVGGGKSAIGISKLATINVLDSSRAEITPADPKVQCRFAKLHHSLLQFAKPILSAIQKSIPNASTQVGPQKILLILPKGTMADRDVRAEAVKKLSESYKNEVRDLRRRALNELKDSTKDKDAISAFERDLQKEHDSVIKRIEELVSAKLRLIGVKK
jgi:ribosome recycling factor